MNLATLYSALERHDWYYHQSDDHGVYLQGEANGKALKAMAALIPGGDELFKAYAAHVFSGPPWHTDKQPKPERPV
jgi:hypothetical protein